MTNVFALLALCAACAEIDPPTTSTTTQASSLYDDYLLGLAPVSYWRLGESSGSAVDRISGGTGTYVNSPTRSQPGAIVNDVNKSVRFDAAAQQHLAIPDADKFSLAKAQDSFDRASTASGWSPATGGWDHGGPWTPQVTTSSSYYRISDGRGRIDQTKGAGTWQIGLGTVVQDADIQVDGMWTTPASGGAISPVQIVARRVDNTNFYRAILTENADHSLRLSISKQVNGVPTELGGITLPGTYSPWETYTLRFRVVGNALMARAWYATNPEPRDWVGGDPSAPRMSLTVYDDTFASGTVSLRSSNSGSTARPYVFFDNLWIQNPGFSVQAWIKFPYNAEGVCNKFVGEGCARETYWMAKGRGADETAEWGFRVYSSDSPPSASIPMACGDDEEQSSRANRVSFYVFHPDGGEGSGASFQFGKDLGTCDAWSDQCPVGSVCTDNNPATGNDLQNPLARCMNPQLSCDEWYHVVGTLDAGDRRDRMARARIYINGQVYGDEHPGSLYSNEEHPISPKNRTSPVRFATQHFNAYFSGWLDEVAFFDRTLSPEEIQYLYWEGIGFP